MQSWRAVGCPVARSPARKGAIHVRRPGHRTRTRGPRRAGPSVKRRGTGGLAAWAALGCLVAFAVLALVVTRDGGAPLPGDLRLASWSLAHRPDVALALARGVTYTGTG